MPATDALPPPSLAERFVAIIGLLCRAVADRPARDAASRPLILPAWTRLRRLCARFVALASADEAGRLAAPRPRTAAARRAPATPPATRLLPGRFGWLLELAPHVDTRIARTQVEHWLADPEVTALAETAPQAGSILRPLCRMLGIEPPPALRLPKRPRVRRNPSPAAASTPITAAGPAPDARRPLPSWLQSPPSPPLPGLPPPGDSCAARPDPYPD